MPDSPDQLYADDLRPGARFRGPDRILDADMFRVFADLTGDAHPIHYDEAYAANTPFGRCIAHGLLMMAMTALGATGMSRRLEDAMIAMVDQGCRFLRPAVPGDRVGCDYEVESVEIKPERHAALVRFAVRLTGAAGETLLEGHQTYLLRRRPEEGRAGV